MPYTGGIILMARKK